MQQKSNAKRIDELKERKRELYAQREDIRARMEAGALNDNFPLFFTNEEIRSVNAQLRALAHKKTAVQKSAGESDFAVNKKLYSDWLHEDESAAMDEYHRELKQVARNAMQLLTDKQAFYYARWAEGIPISDIAKTSGVDPSVVSRTISRAKKRIRDEFEIQHVLPRGKMKVVDLADDDVLKLILSLLTPHQAVCMYMYYGEWLSLRDCASILQIDHSTIYRTIQRGLTNISNGLNCNKIRLENVDAIGELAYESYVKRADEMECTEVLTKKEWKERLASGEKRKEYKKREKSPEELKSTFVIANAKGESCRGIRRKDGERHEPGKLLSLLIKTGRVSSIKKILVAVFEGICKSVYRASRERKKGNNG